MSGTSPTGQFKRGGATRILEAVDTILGIVANANAIAIITAIAVWRRTHGPRHGNRR